MIRNYGKTIFWTIFSDFFSEAVFFSDIFDFVGLILVGYFFLDSFESVLLKIVSRKYDFIAVPVSCFLCCLNFFDHFFIFGSLVFARLMAYGQR